MRYVKIFFPVILLMIVTANVSAQKKNAAQRKSNATHQKQTVQTEALDEWEVFTDNGKLYGFRNKRTGKTEWQPKFEELRPFHENENLTVGKYEGKYYLFDRNGRCVLDKGFGYIYYWPEQKSAEIFDFEDFKHYIINLRGDVIVPKYKERLETNTENVVFLVEEPDDKYARLVMLDQSRISDLRFDNNHWNVFVARMTNPDKMEAPDSNYVMIFTQDEKKGVMNMQGEILIPAVYDSIDLEFIDSGETDEYMKIMGNICPKEFVQTFCYLRCKDNKAKTFTYYDYAGTLLGKKGMKKYLGTQYGTTGFKKYAKDVFIPYFKDYASNLKRLQEKVFAPSEACNARKQAFINALPSTPEFSSLNILDMTGDMLAKNRRFDKAEIADNTKNDANVQKFRVLREDGDIELQTYVTSNIDNNICGGLRIMFLKDQKFPAILFYMVNYHPEADDRVRKVIGIKDNVLLGLTTLVLTLSNGEQFRCRTFADGEVSSLAEVGRVMVGFPLLDCSGFGVKGDDDRSDTHAFFNKLSTYDLAKITIIKDDGEEISFTYDFSMRNVQHTAPTISSMLKELRKLRYF